MNATLHHFASLPEVVDPYTNFLGGVQIAPYRFVNRKHYADPKVFQKSTQKNIAIYNVSRDFLGLVLALLDSVFILKRYVDGLEYVVAAGRLMHAKERVKVNDTHGN